MSDLWYRKIFHVKAHALSILRNFMARIATSSGQTVTLVFVCLAYALPCLMFRHLPMTDLPQHEAIVSIMRHLHDPSYGFGNYYEWALNRTLYVLPYFFALGLSYVMPVNHALHVTLFISLFLYPLGVLLLLKAIQQPQWLSLLALPIVYNHAFFWGFINFCLGVGLAFLVLSQLVGPWSRGKGWIVAGLCLLTAVTHVYGLAIIFTYAACWLLAGDRRTLLSRIPWTLPAVLALCGWGLFAANAPGYGMTEWMPFETRLKEMGHSVLGGYKDDSENLLLYGLVAVTCLLVLQSIPLTWGRWKRLGVHAKAAYFFVIVNIVAYFTLPAATPTAKFIHFRHAVLAAMMLPLLVDGVLSNRTKGVAKPVIALLVVYATVNSWWHLYRFEQESSDFGAIMAGIAARSKIAQLTYEAKGSIMRTHPYMHFGAYAQSRKGGVFAVSFPRLFWNIPIKGRDGTDMPDTPKNMEWAPERFNQHQLGQFYDTIIVRGHLGSSRRLNIHFPYQLQGTIGSWELYHRVGAGSR